MTNKEIIDYLESEINADAEADNFGMFVCSTEVGHEIIALLKEQEPKPVGKEWNECPTCGKTLDRIHDMHYCGVCGQAVKW